MTKCLLICLALLCFSVNTVAQFAVVSFSKSEKTDDGMGVVGTDVITLINRCAYEVRLRETTSSDKGEYRLAPGQEMKYDDSSGPLAIWNFKRQNWSVGIDWRKDRHPDEDGKFRVCG